MSATRQEPGARTERLAVLAGVLLPGDEDFPSAASIGVQWVAERRLEIMLGAADTDRLFAAIETAFGAEPDAEAATRALETAEPTLFADLLRVVYFSYYDHPSVIAAIRSLGFDYNDAPQPEGYAMAPFDPATDLPSDPKGGYVATDQVRRVDLSGLDHLKPGGA